MAEMAKRIALGSGKIYLTTKTAEMDFADIEAVIEQYALPANEFAAVKNGASVTYTPTMYSASDDLSRFTKTITQDEVVTLGCGLITINSDVLNALVDTARVEKKEKAEIIRIGGAGNAKGDSYLLIFEHLDAKDGNIYVVIVGKNSGELSFSFQKSNETILNPVFTAEGMDDDGTKMAIVMQKPEAAAA